MDHHDPQIPPPHHHPHHHHGGGTLIHSSTNPYYHHHHQHQQQHQHQHQQQPTTMSTASMISPNNSSHFLHNNRFPFTSVSPPPKPLEPPNSGFPGDGSSELKPEGGGGGGGGGVFGVDASKKKRGRPRKYSPDGGNIALGLAPAPVSVSTAVVAQGDCVGSPREEAPSSSSKKHRGRPPGSGKKQLDALGNCGVGFTPHVILVNAGEDIASKIMAFSQQGPRTVCIMSANGSICNVTLRQSTNSSGTVTYEGRFEIISLIGSFVPSESGGNRVRTGGLSISVAGPDGRVVGGGVAGMLVAASPVQIIVGSFVADGKKPKYMPYVAESRMLHFGAPPPPSTATISPPSHEEASSESSEDKASVGQLNRAPGPFNNHSAAQQHPHNMQQQQQQQLYSAPMGWPNAGNSKMLHH